MKTILDTEKLKEERIKALRERKRRNKERYERRRKRKQKEAAPT